MASRLRQGSRDGCRPPPQLADLAQPARPNLVAIIETLDSREIAETIWTSAETKAAMEADGIDMTSLRIEFLDEVDSG